MRKVFIVALMVMTLAIMVTSAGLSLASKTTQSPGRVLSEVMPANSSFWGMSYSDLVAGWGQWAFGQEDGIVPGYTEDGYLLAEQTGKVWFLAGSFLGAPEEREITIPYGKAIFFPIINVSYIGFPWLDTDTPEYGWSMVTPSIDLVDAGKLKCVIDGVEVPNLASYRVATKTRPDGWSYWIEIPLDNPFSPPDRPPDFDGLYPTVSDGYWVLLKPLTAGKHTIQFYAEGEGGFIQDITYHVTIAER